MSKLTVYYLDQHDQKQLSVSTDSNTIKAALNWWEKSGNIVYLKSDNGRMLFVPLSRVLLMELVGDTEAESDDK